MPNTYFRFRQFTIHQNKTAMKVCTDACLFGAWTVSEISNDKIERILDIGTGTGLLSLMVAQATDARIDSVEIDDNANEQASENFKASPWSSKLQLHHCAVQQFDPPYRFDLIICNPPFYENDLLSPDMKKNIAMHSTQLGADELFYSMRRLLAPGGKIAILVPYHRTKTIERKINDNKLFIYKKVAVKQTEKHSPFRCMYLIKEVFSGFSESIITVKDDEFNSLLKSYYL